MNEMNKVKSAYEQVFNSIEGDESDVNIEWCNDPSNAISRPKFVPKNKPHSLTVANKLTQRKSANQSELVTTTTTTTTTTVATTSSSQQNHLQNELDLDIEKLSYLELDNLKKMSKAELISLRENVSFEMLWIQQAIQSRMQVLLDHSINDMILYYHLKHLFFKII
jgi:hypothetical protein